MVRTHKRVPGRVQSQVGRESAREKWTHVGRECQGELSQVGRVSGRTGRVRSQVGRESAREKW